VDSRILAVAFVVLASGCVHSGSGSSGSSLEISEFEATDSDLVTGQETTLRLVLINHGTQTEIRELRPVDLGDLKQADSDWTDWSSHCTPGELPEPTKDEPGIMECIWDIKAPSNEVLGSFSSREYSPGILLRYRSAISNGDEPVKLHFKDEEKIESDGEIDKSFSNGEVEFRVKTDQPLPTDTELPVRISLSAPESHLVSEYTVSLTPESLVKGCQTNKGSSSSGAKISLKPNLNGDGELTCMIRSQESGERNLVISTSYIYQKSPNTKIKVKER